jgi:hypothetical protein
MAFWEGYVYGCENVMTNTYVGSEGPRYIGHFRGRYLARCGVWFSSRMATEGISDHTPSW